MSLPSWMCKAFYANAVLDLVVFLIPGTIAVPEPFHNKFAVRSEFLTAAKKHPVSAPLESTLESCGGCVQVHSVSQLLGPLGPSISTVPHAARI